MNETKLFDIILLDFLFTCKLESSCLCLFPFDLAQSKQDFANIHVSLGWNWAKYTQGSPGIHKLIVQNKFQNHVL